MRGLGTPLLINQPDYNMFERWIEKDLLQVLEEEGIGCITYSSLAQGLLTSRYFEGIPAGSRAARPEGELKREDVTAQAVGKAKKLNEMAKRRGQSLAQMSVAWNLRQKSVTSALVGASSPQQIEELVGALNHLAFSAEELQVIDQVLVG
jgi:L-glyceraldehyde 3-phosphate reductase